MPLKNKLLAYFGHHKCATVWIHNIMVEVCRTLGRKTVNLNSSNQFNGDLAGYIRSHNLDCLTYANADHRYVKELNNFSAFHVVRDPRDLAVSSYFSHLYSHPTRNWPQLEAHRDTLKSLPMTEGIIRDMEFIHRDVFRPMATWDYNQNNILELKMEELTANPRKQFINIFKFLGILETKSHGFFKKSLNEKRLARILEKNSFTRLSGGRKPGQEDQTHHFRKGTPGDWRNHFTPEVAAYFKERYGSLVIKLGYEQ